LAVSPKEGLEKNLVEGVSSNKMSSQRPMHRHKNILRLERSGGSDRTRFISPRREELGLYPLSDVENATLFHRSSGQKVFEEISLEGGFFERTRSLRGVQSSHRRAF